MEFENPYEGWECYECEVSEQVTKIIRIFGRDEESTKRYLQEIMDTIDMKTGIDEYKKTAKVCGPCEAESDYSVPDWWYE